MKKHLGVRTGQLSALVSSEIEAVCIPNPPTCIIWGVGSGYGSPSLYLDEVGVFWR